MDEQYKIFQNFHMISESRFEDEAKALNQFNEIIKFANLDLMNKIEKIESQMKLKEQDNLFQMYKSFLKLFHKRPGIEQKGVHFLQETEQINIFNKEEGKFLFQKAIAKIRSKYNNSLQRIIKENEDFIKDSGIMVAPWNDKLWKEWKPVNKLEPNIRIGNLVKKKQYNSLTMPALLTIIGGCNLMIKVSNPKSNELGVEAINSIMLRMLALTPPGRIRFTLIDPLSHGQSIESFLCLGDFLEDLVGTKVWTQSDDIEKQLGNLTEKMEFIIQSLLRDKYQTIEEYNINADEMAEPYRILVIFNFPNNFSEKSARLLKSISINGNRCGIYTLLTVDTEYINKIEDNFI